MNNLPLHPFRIYWCFLGALLFFICGCAQKQVSLDPTDLPKQVVVSQEDIPDSLDNLTAALLARLTGKKIPSNVTFAKHSQEDSPETSLSSKPVVDEYFSLVTNQIYAVQTYDKENQWQITGTFVLADRFGRQAGFLYQAIFSQKDRQLLIHNHDFSPVYPNRPKVNVFFVPTKALELKPDLFSSFATLYEAVQKQAITILDSGSIPDGAYHIIAFSMDRTSDDALFELAISDNPDEQEGFSKRSQCVTLHGFKVSVMTGTFAPPANNPLYLKVFYKPGTEKSWSRRKTLHLESYALNPLSLGQANQALKSLGKKTENIIALPGGQFAVLPFGQSFGWTVGSPLGDKDAVSHALIKKYDGNILMLSWDSNKAALWMSVISLYEVLADNPPLVQVDNKPSYSLIPLEGERWVATSDNYVKTTEGIHWKIFEGDTLPEKHTLLEQLRKGNKVVVWVSTQTRKNKKITFSLKNSSWAIKKLLQAKPTVLKASEAE